MTAELLALVSALGFASSQVAGKRGLRTVSVEASLLVSLGCAWLVIALATLARSPGGMEARAGLIFFVSGLITPGISRWASMTAVDRLGPSVSVPLQVGARPVLAVLGAMATLGETVGPLRTLGIAGVVVGGWRLSLERLSSSGAGRSGDSRGHAAGWWRPALRPGIAFPLLAASAYATSDLLVKKALGTSPEPFLGATIGIGSAWAAWCLIGLALPPVRRGLRFGPGVRWFVLSGTLAGVAILTLFSALEKGDVSLVAPMTSVQPLMVFVLSRLLLHDLEVIERSTVVSGLMVVAGAILVSL